MFEIMYKSLKKIPLDSPYGEWVKSIFYRPDHYTANYGVNAQLDVCFCG